MKVAMFGKFSDDQVKPLKKADHVILTTDAPSDKALVALAAKHKIKCVAARAEWKNLEHDTSVVGTRVSFQTGEAEEYNVNGGQTRDALLLEQADAILLGEGVSAYRAKLAEASGKPVKAFEAPKLTPEDAQAELDRLYAS